MRVAPALSLALLLAAGLGMKACAWRPDGRADQASAAQERADIVRWLTRNGFDQAALEGEAATVAGARRGCRLIVVAVDARGFHRDTLAAMRPAGGGLFFVLRGQIYPQQPMWRGWWLHQRWARARDMGIRLTRDVPLGVVNLGCDAGRLPWSDVGRIA